MNWQQLFLEYWLLSFEVCSSTPWARHWTTSFMVASDACPDLKAVFYLFIYLLTNGQLLLIQSSSLKANPFTFYFPKRQDGHFSHESPVLTERQIFTLMQQDRHSYTHVQSDSRSQSRSKQPLHRKRGSWQRDAELVLSLLVPLEILGGNDWKPLRAGVFTKRISHSVVKQAWWIKPVQYWESHIDHERRREERRQKERRGMERRGEERWG